MAEDAESWDGGSPWLFLLGLVVFLGSGLLFVADLIRDIDVARSVGANAAGAALLIVWAAQDTYLNPDSDVDSFGGAVGTALLLYGLYLVGAGTIIALTGLVHDRLRLGFGYLGLAIAIVIIGFLIFPRESIVDGEQPVESEDSEGPDRSESHQNGKMIDEQGTGDQ